jgi:hypothetical protein
VVVEGQNVVVEYRSKARLEKAGQPILAAFKKTKAHIRSPASQG